MAKKSMVAERISARVRFTQSTLRRALKEIIADVNASDDALGSADRAEATAQCELLFDSSVAARSQVAHTVFTASSVCAETSYAKPQRGDAERLSQAV